MLIDVSQNKIECQTKATFVPTLLSLHPDQTLGMYNLEFIWISVPEA